jgi:hypothetical protein
VKPSEVLRAARKLIEKPGAWALDWYAYDKFGDRCSPTNPIAVCFCTLGAIKAAIGDDNEEHVLYTWSKGFLRRAVGSDPKWNAATWNDRANHSDVIGAFAIAETLAESEGQ